MAALSDFMILVKELIFYFGPMWLAVGYCLFHKRLSQRVLNTCAIIALMIAYSAGVYFGSTVFGIWNTIMWITLMTITFELLIRKGFKLHYGIFMAVTMTLFMTAVWEIPIDCIFVGMSFTFEQLVLKTMLASPYLALGIPLFFELRKFNLHRWFTMTLLSGTMIMSLPFAPIFDNFNSFILQPSGYPLYAVDQLYRLVWCAVAIIFAIKIPSVNKNAN